MNPEATFGNDSRPPFFDVSPVTVAVELRPPRAELDATAGIEAWIDTYHAVRRLTRQHVSVLLTDSAVGEREEHNLRHLVANLGDDAPRDQVLPFLTAKHTLDYCLDYADRAWEYGFRSLVVVGGDISVPPPRCVKRGWELRRAVRERQPGLRLGGWANPHRNAARQVEYLLDPNITADFFLTQVASHHDLPAVERFLDAARRDGLSLPGLYGVFFYRSANSRTLDTLSRFLPVPREQLVREFSAGASAEEICARSVRALRTLGVQRIYISNLPVERAASMLSSTLRLAASI